MEQHKRTPGEGEADTPAVFGVEDVPPVHLTILFGKFTQWFIVVLQFCDLSSTRNITVLGVSFLIGLMVPEWLSESAEKVKTDSNELDHVILVLFGTASFAAGFTGFVLDNIVPGSKHERGKDRWLKVSDTSTQHPEARVCRIYDLPFVTKYIKRVPICRLCPILPSSAGCNFSCGKSSSKKASFSETVADKDPSLLPLQEDLEVKGQAAV